MSRKCISQGLICAMTTFVNDARLCLLLPKFPTLRTQCADTRKSFIKKLTWRITKPSCCSQQHAGLSKITMKWNSYSESLSPVLASRQPLTGQFCTKVIWIFSVVITVVPIQYQNNLSVVLSLHLTAVPSLVMGQSNGGENNRNLPDESISLTLCSVHSLEHYIETRCVRVLGWVIQPCF